MDATIAALAELERAIAEREETIRQLRDPVAVHIAMLRGEIAVPPLAELLHVYGATFSDLDAANIEIAKARAEAAKWERLHDELYAEIASEHRRDEYGEAETAAECVGRIVRERDALRAKLAEYEQAPTVAWLATQQQRNPSQCVVTTKLDGWDHVELIARQTRKAQEPVWQVIGINTVQWKGHGPVLGAKLYAAPPIPRVEQEPVAWVLFDDIFIAPKDMQDDPPNLECMKPLYAHPLALREPTDDECREIWRAIRRTTATDQITGGRAMWQAVREVMTK